MASEPDKFLMPVPSDLRFHWVRAQMSMLDVDELDRAGLEAWRMVVPKKVAREHLGSDD